MKVLGIDPGAHVGVALLDVGANQAQHLDCDDADWIEGLLPASIRMALDQVELIAIERVLTVHGNPRMGAALATGLALSNWVGGKLAGIAVQRGLRVVTVSAAEWRKALTGEPYPPDRRIKQMVQLRVPNWPKRSNEHQRDAAGVALWAGLRT